MASGSALTSDNARCSPSSSGGAARYATDHVEPVVGDCVEVDWKLGVDDDDDDDEGEEQFRRNGCYKNVVMWRPSNRPGRLLFNYEIAYEDGGLKVEDLNDRR